jgi:EmrB/QacA subfamily drug resistance transporter
MHLHHHNHTTHAGRSDNAKHTGGWLLAILLVAQLMVILDITAVNIAMPNIAKDLGIGGTSISWTITSYSLVFGSLLLLGGRAADLLGRRRLFVTGLGVFTVSSLLSAMAGSGAALFAARAGQGLGASMLSPAALSIITTAFQGQQRAKALAAWGAIGGAGAAIGVLLGGVLTQLADWRMIFFVNPPVAIALAVAATRIIPADTKRPQWKGLDLRGAAVATASIGTIVYAITQADQAGWTSAQTLIMGGAGLAGLGLFAACERRTEQPLLRIERLRDRAVSGGMILMLLGAGLIFGLFLLCSLYMQFVLGEGPLSTGLSFIPLALAAGAGAHVGGHVINRHGVRGPLAAAFGIASVGLLLLSRLGPHGSYVQDILPGIVIAGFGLGIATVAISVSILTGARSEETGMLSGLNSTGHEIGGTLGIAVFTSIAAAVSGGLTGSSGASGIADAFLIAAHVAAVASIAALIVLPAARVFLPKLRLNPQAMAIH